MPTQLPSGTAIAAIPAREDPRDVLVVSSKYASTYKTLASLPPNSVIGTSSVRRTAQLRRLHPHLKFLDCRGNLGTRLAKLDAEDSPFTALVLAAAGLHRLGWHDRITSYLEGQREKGGMLYAVGQGALAIQIREGDEQAQHMLETVGSERTTRAALAERNLMRTLEGGCSVPIGVETEWVKQDGSTTGVTFTGLEDDLTEKLTLRAVVVSVDGKDAVEAELTETVDSRDAALAFGKKMASVLVEKGAQKILQEINFTRRNVEGNTLQGHDLE